MKRETFHTAKDTEFCARNRVVGLQDWTVDRASIFEEKGTVSAVINDNSNATKLNLSIGFHANRIAHIRISPLQKEAFNRFDVSKEFTIVDPNVVTNHEKIELLVNDNDVIIISQNVELSVNFSPFKIVIKDENGESIEFNCDNDAIYEQNRDKAKNPELFKPTTFNGFVDPIKNGPTSVAMSMKFIGDDIRMSGLPSHSLPLTLPDTTDRDPIRFFNTDMNHFGLNETMSMYGAIPFLLAHATNRSAGMFWANASETWVDVKNAVDKSMSTTRFISEGGLIDCYFFFGNAKDIMNSFTVLTGRPMLLPRFTLAYHQCKWGYHNQEMFEEATHKLDEYGVPHDVMWADIDYTKDMKYFAFNPETYPHPEKFISDFDKDGRKLVTIVDPHIKVDKSFHLYNEAHDQKLVVLGPDGKDFEGDCWPGLSVWADYMNPETRKWWASCYSFDKFKQSAENVYIWNDMNEISVFGGPEGSCPHDLIHYGNIEEREVHNIYGHLMVSATADGLRNRSKKTMRPFVLTRSFFAGSQKYSGCWGGDNQSTFGYLRGSIQMLLSFGIAGMTFTGSDVGGFFDNPSDKLLSRWHMVGAWVYPFFRNHAIIDMPQREIPIMKSETEKQLAKESVIERYQMIPFWYSLLKESNESGIPLVRPLWLEFNGAQYSDVDDSVMLGSKLMIVPFLDEEETDREFVLPDEKWYNFRTFEPVTSNIAKYDQGRTLVLLRGGSIIPTKNKIEKTSQLMFNHPITLTIALNDQNEAEGKFYEDDGLSEDALKGEYVYKQFIMKDNKLTSKSLNEINSFSENYKVEIETIKIVGMKKPNSVKTTQGKVDFVHEDKCVTLHCSSLQIRDEWEIIFS